MKKILLMLALMLPCLGVWAAVTKPESGVYVISGGTTAEPRGNLAACEGIADYPALSNITWAAHSSKSNPAIENGEHWYVYQVGEKYVIYNLGLDKYLVKSNDNKINFGEAPYLWDILVNPSNNNFNSIWDATSSYISFACGTKANGTGTRNVNFYTKSDDGGSLHTFTTVENGETTYATKIAEIQAIMAVPETAISYTLTDVNGSTYTGTYTGRPGYSSPQIVGATISNYVWNETTLTADVSFSIPVSNASTKNQVTISPFQNTSFKYYVTGSDVKTTNSASVTNHLWEIYPSFTNGEFEFQIKNVATGKYISTSLESNTNPNQGNVTVTESEGTYFTLDSNNQFKVKGKNVYLSTHSSSSSDQYATVWGSHGGTKNTITLVNTINLVTYILTDTDGNTYTTSVEGEKGVDPVFTGIEGYTLSNQSWSGNTFTATINFNLPFAVSSETTTNLITIGQGTWAGAEGGADAKLWTVVDGNVKVVNGVPTLGTTQWMVYPTMNGTKIGFKIKSASTGKYVTANLESGNDEKANNTPVTLTPEGTEFSFIDTKCVTDNDTDKGFAYTNNYGVTMYLTRNGVNDNNALLGVYQASTSHHGSGLRFPKFNQYKVVIGGAGYTTIYSPFPVWRDFSGNSVEIYTIAEREVVNNKVQLTQMSYYIPEGGAAILKGEPGDYVFIQTDDDPEMNADWEQNKLQGSSVNTIVKGEAYVLGNKSMGVALYLAYLDMNENGEIVENDGTHFLNNAGKAYLPADAIDMRIQALSFNFGGTTAIESVLNSTDANAPIYDLSGRRVMNTVKGGIYIQNGKKFIVK